MSPNATPRIIIEILEKNRRMNASIPLRHNNQGGFLPGDIPGTGGRLRLQGGERTLVGLSLFICLFGTACGYNGGPAHHRGAAAWGEIDCPLACTCRPETRVVTCDNGNLRDLASLLREVRERSKTVGFSDCYHWKCSMIHVHDIFANLSPIYQYNTCLINH